MASDFNSEAEMEKDTVSLQGICKDCGNGTLNNELNPAFEIQDGEYDYAVAHCLRCGSYHVEVL